MAGAVLAGCLAGERTVDTAPAHDPLTGPVPLERIPPAPVLAPEGALRDLQVEDGFAVELVAAEPQVVDPVALAFDGNAAMWVVEMRGYMPDVDGTGEDAPVGRIVVLRDQDEDGTYEQATTFLDGLVLPRAVLPLHDGVLVAEPPLLYFVENNSYTAGRKTVVDSAYATGGDPEHLPNGLLWARDNWIYSAKSDTRYRRVDGEWIKEKTEFRGQWGITQDDVGQLFYNHNSATLLGDDFLPNAFRANPHHMPVSEGRYGEQKVTNRVFPRRMTPGVNRGYLDNVLDERGFLIDVTSACGPGIYRGDQFPKEYYGNAFVPEPAAYLVKRVVLADSAGQVVGALPYLGHEFLTATDERFRPVNAYTAPDGSLFLVDMYRGVIQHRTYLTDYLRRQIAHRGLETPVGLGRIYRVRYEGRPVGRLPRMRDETTEQLVAHLTHPNGWWRDTAQRLLVERNDQSIIPALRRLGADANHPVGQIHALWTLEGLAALTPDLLQQAARAADPKVAATAIRLTEKLATTDASRAALDVLTSLESTDSQVHLQRALSAHAFHAADSTRTLSLLAELTATYGGKPLFIDAILGGLEDREATFSEYLRAHDVAVPPAFAAALAAARINAETQPAALVNLLDEDGQALFEAGEPVYQATCANCHGADGAGIRTLAPPLVRSRWVLQDPETLIRLVLDGLEGPVAVDGITYAPPAIAPLMPGHRTTPGLDDAKLAALLTYVRNAWQNRAPAVHPEAVAAVREATTAHAGHTYTPGELDALETVGWTPLFDGETLDGWMRLGGEATYEVHDGKIIGTTVPNTPNTFLATEQHYGDFILELEVKVDSLLNSGIQIRSNSYADYQEGRVHGYQVEIDPSDRAWSGGIYDEARRGWLFNLEGRPKAQQAFQPDAWNHYRIEARGPHLRTWVNGVLAADLIDTRTASGFIALQVHSIADSTLAGRPVQWRSIRIKDLGTSSVRASSDPVATPITAATDGDPATRWQAEGDSAWIEIDLREPQPVSGIEIDFYRGDERRYDLAITLSEDGERWQEAFRGVSQGIPEPERFELPVRPVRYIRILGFGNTEDAANAYNEIRVIADE